MSDRNKLKALNKLYKNGVEVLSYSRMNTFNGDCPYQYYLQYIKKVKRGDSGVYAHLGGESHDILENYYSNIINKSDMVNIFKDKFEMSQNNGVTFPAGLKSANNYKQDMIHFFENHKDLNYKFIALELPIIVNIDGIHIQGYIDCIYQDKDTNEYYIIDWKTSRKFSSKDKEKSKMQLLLYKIGIEQLYPNISIKMLAWDMLKYCKLSYDTVLKSGKISRKSTIIERKDLESKKIEILGKYHNNGSHDMNVIDYSIDGDWNNFESYDSANFDIEDFIDEYEATDESVQEAINYVLKTKAKMIELGDEEDNYDFCGCKDSCKFYQRANNIK